MKSKKKLAILVATLVMIAILAATLVPLKVFADVPQCISYQGYLTDSGGNPVNGGVGILFYIYDVPSGGTALWGEMRGVTVNNGLFSVQLGSGGSLPANLFDGTPRYLEITVNGEVLSPRQQLSSAPFAVKSGKADSADTLDGYDSSQFASSSHAHSGSDITSGTVADARIAGSIARDSEIMSTVLANDGSGSNLDADLVDGLHLTDLDARYEGGADSDWTIAGDNMYSGVSGNVGIGTTSPEFKLSLDSDGGILAKGAYNSGATLATGGAGTRLLWYPRRAAFRAGGVNGSQWDNANIGAYSVAMGYNNTASSTFATVGGGNNNTASDSVSTVGGGFVNTASGQYATVGGGDHNTASGDWATVSGGVYNTASGQTSTVGGGYYNTASGHATVSGGEENTASGYYATVGGGALNTASGLSATVGGGEGNSASGYRATVCGGRGNKAEAYASTVIGQYNVGGGTPDSWVGTDPIFEIGTGTGNESRANAVTVLKNGNVGIGTTTPVSELEVNGRLELPALVDASGTPGTGAIEIGNSLRIDGNEILTNDDTVLYLQNDNNGDLRVDSSTLVVDASANRVGIGTTTPDATLEVNGDLHVTGAITRAYTVGTSNRAAPLAYAFINSSGTVASGTPNVSSSWNAGSLHYEITIAGESYYYNDYVTVVTPTGGAYLCRTNSGSGKLWVYIYNLSGTQVQSSFQFVTYKP